MTSTFEDIDYDELLEPVRFRFAVDRRAFVRTLGAGVVITAIGTPAFAQRRGRGRGGFLGGPPVPLSSRFHFADDGTITVFSGKVDAGQGARCELAQAAAEELCVPFERIKMVLADTGDCPNDGTTAGSGTTPRTVPAIRQAAAALRKLLADRAAEMWSVDAGAIEAKDGVLFHVGSTTKSTYIELLKDDELTKRLSEPRAKETPLTPIAKWTTLGSEHAAPAAR